MLGGRAGGEGEVIRVPEHAHKGIKSWNLKYMSEIVFWKVQRFNAVQTK